MTGVRGAVNTHNNVVLRWKTVTEERIAGFNIYRQTKSGAWKQLNANQRVAKHAGTALSDKYRFTDRSVKAGRTYRYKLQVVYLDNHTEWSSIIKVKTP